MAGTIVADTLQDGAGNSTAMDNAIYGSAKAWVNFVGSSGAVSGSYNVSSVTRTGTGAYTINMTNALSNANYATVAITGSYNTFVSLDTSAPTTSARYIICRQTSSPTTSQDPNSVQVAMFS